MLIEVGEQLTATEVTVGLDGRLLLPEPPPQPAASVSTPAAATWTMTPFIFRKANVNDFISCIPPPQMCFYHPIAELIAGSLLLELQRIRAVERDQFLKPPAVVVEFEQYFPFE